ncbi:hypothetical protein [Mucilaginibacter segetis]|uniref:Uncharacterized protein n=1 Tax=Mucilaginibacter segetis TaxID=2793071 RepID=A0A934PT19_9SPHI|nr:hypothetical protein [Mucilaginibacter segetis]MBK0378900.1 hypothetical protein [Mucilaginibacter segetis]
MYAEDNAKYVFSASGPNDILYNQYKIASSSTDQKKIDELRMLEQALKYKFRQKKNKLKINSQNFLNKSQINLYKIYSDSLIITDSLIIAEDMRLRRSFIAANKATFYTPYLINQAADLFENYDFYKNVLGNLNEKIKESSYTKEAEERLKAVTKLYKGAKVPEIAGQDIKRQEYQNRLQ